MDRYRIAVLFFVLLFAPGFFITPAVADWKFNPTVGHVPQPENWMCGPSSIAMWAGFIRKQSLNPYTIADDCCGNDSTTVPEFMVGMYDFTPYGYVFSEWEYNDKEAAVKAIMWTIARFNQPVAIPVKDGSHWIIVRGGQAMYNPYTYYTETNHIKYVYVNDPTENAPGYSIPKTKMYKDKAYAPSVLMENWTKIGAWNDKKYRSVERNCSQCWDTQGATYENNDSFSKY